MVEKMADQAYPRTIGLNQPRSSKDTQQSLSDGIYIEEMCTGADGQQILVSTIRKPIRVKRIVSSNRAMQFVGFTSDETFQAYLRISRR
jgi:hypothetical protein